MENNKFLSGNEQFEAFCSNNVDIAQVLAALPPDRAYNFKHHMWIGWHGHQSVRVPSCPGCGYTEQDCREQMDHHLCGLPEPAPARPVRFSDLPPQLLDGETQVELMRDALDHIARTCHQSRQQSRRIRWIEARADGALEGKPYDAKLIELPIQVDREIDRMKRRDGRHLARIRVLEAALQENHAWHKLYDEHDGYAESALYQTNVEALGSTAESCTWSSLEFSWSSTCGMAGWEFTDGGTPEENGMKFCHCCGKPITVAVPEDEA